MKSIKIIAILAACLSLQACVHKLVTVPVKVAYKTTKTVAKGAIAVGKAVIPGDSDDDNGKKK